MHEQSDRPRAMKITCLIFGKYAEAVGTGNLVLELEDNSDVRGALEKIRNTLPNGERIPQATMVAVNQAHALSTQRLQDGDELALLPPLAGG